MTPRLIFTFLLFCVGLTAGAQTFTEWQDPAVFEVNKLYPRANIPRADSRHCVSTMDARHCVPTTVVDGQWMFHYVPNADERPTDFFRTDFDASGWNTIPVPGNWELNGYGVPVYVNTTNDFDNSRLPKVPVKRRRQLPQVGGHRQNVGGQASNHQHRGREVLLLLVGERRVRGLQRGRQDQLRVRHHPVREVRGAQPHCPAGLQMERRFLFRVPGFLAAERHRAQHHPLRPTQNAHFGLQGGGGFGFDV